MNPTQEFMRLGDNWREEWRKMIAAAEEGMDEKNRAAHQLYAGLVERMLEHIMARRAADGGPDTATLMGHAMGQAFFTGLSFVGGPLHMMAVAELGMAAFVSTFTQNLAASAAAPSGKPN